MRTADGARPDFPRERAAVTVTFAAHAVAAGTLGPWIPRLKADAGLDEAGLGLALAGFAVGLVAGTRLAGPLLRRIGGRRVVRGGIPALAATLALLSLAGGSASLTAAFAAFGIASGVLDVAMNTEAVAVEGRFGRRVMSAMHGTWSVSVLAGAAIASAGVAAGVPIEIHLSVIGALLVAASFPALRWLPAPLDAGPTEGPAPTGPSERSWSRRIVLLCLIAFASFLSEGVAIDWSAVYLRGSVGSGAAIAGLGVVAFSAGMAASRFAGDRLATRFGPARLVRAGASVAGIALAVALALGGTAPTIAGFALVGLGLGPVVPAAFSAAGAIARPGGRTALGVVVTAGYLGSILGPLAVGFIADLENLRVALVVPVAMCAAAALAASAVGERRGPAGRNTAGDDGVRTR
jgi:MFS family permease